MLYDPATVVGECEPNIRAVKIMALLQSFLNEFTSICYGYQ